MKKIKCFILIIAVLIGCMTPVASLPNVEAATVINIKYDDRYTFPSKIKTLYSTAIASYQLNSKKKDTAVLQIDPLNPKRVIATGCGKARVVLNNKKTYTVAVAPAHISLVLLVGQSNMEGALTKDSAKKKAQKAMIRCKEGTVYNTYAPATASSYENIGFYGLDGAERRSIDNVTKFIPSSLTDNSAAEVWKHTNNLTDGLGAVGKSGVDAGIGYQWYETSGEKIWMINCAKSGTSITQWQTDGKKCDNLFWQSVVLYQAAEKLLNQEITACHYVLSKKGIFWCQGEQDTYMSQENYEKYFHNMVANYETYLRGTNFKYLNHALDFIGILMVRSYEEQVGYWYFPSGPRVAQYEMCKSTSVQNKKIILASYLEEQWTSKATITAYFYGKYGNNATYNALNPTYTKLKLPKKVSDIYYSPHFSQRARNEIGRDAALNVLNSFYTVQ
ncbi:MAG: sialate O-acetylesterase [Lachnospiraceae bacterium]|nr:sialate O-acetylesterase [Lachnospiraceae bacterium]